MRFNIAWLHEWIDTALNPQSIAERLTLAGLEVDARFPAAPAFSGIVVAEVVSVAEHPRADRLRICDVTVGAGEVSRIVCGAGNVTAGMRAPLAVPGAILPDGTRVGATKLRGELSEGMLCSEKDLGLAEESDGLMSLPVDTPLGQDIRRVLDLDDEVIELDLTPNRGDCLSIKGIARELAALTDESFIGREPGTVSAVGESTFPITVSAPDACPVYAGRVIRGVSAQARTPLWMRERLRRCGIRSMGPIIDVTNYVLLELGQPMHAFDLERLSGGIDVRLSEPGEALTLLNGQTVELRSDTLVIADRGGAVALAGVMGGQRTAVTDTSRDVFLESALFMPKAIAGRARSYGLHTDASHRFERGVDPALPAPALERATALLTAIAGGEPGPVTVVGSAPAPAAPISLRRSRISRVLGYSIPDLEVIAILERLGMTVSENQEGWEVRVPGYRYDLALEVDLIEELARVHGFDRMPQRALRSRNVVLAEDERRLSLPRLREGLTFRGYQEVITYSFVDPELQAGFLNQQTPVDVANPLSREMGQMRASLWPGLMQTLIHNLNRRQERLRLFETGLVFTKHDGELSQVARLGMLLYGRYHSASWAAEERSADFFDLKGDLEALAARSGLAEALRWQAETHPALHPGQSARLYLDDRAVGWAGVLHPALQRRLALPAPAVLAEMELEAVVRGRMPSFKRPSRYPPVHRDLAVVVPADVPAGALREAVCRYGGDLLASASLFDVYQGPGIEPGSKSIAFSLIFQKESSTLSDEEIDEVMAGILEGLARDCRARIRE